MPTFICKCKTAVFEKNKWTLVCAHFALLHANNLAHVWLFFQVLTERGEFQQSDVEFGHVIKLAPSSGMAYAHKGLLQLRWKMDQNAAAEWFRKGIEVGLVQWHLHFTLFEGVWNHRVKCLSFPTVGATSCVALLFGWKFRSYSRQSAGLLHPSGNQSVPVPGPNDWPIGRGAL